MTNEALLQRTLPDSKLVLSETGRGVRDFCLTLYKRSDDSHLLDEQELFYFTRLYQLQCSRCFLRGLDSVQLFVDLFVLLG